MRKSIPPENTMVYYSLLILLIIALPPLAFGAPARDASAVFKNAEGIEWVLSEVRTAGITVRIDRQKLENEGMVNFFTITFVSEALSNEGRMSGTGAPNRYFGPYTVAANRALNIGNVASTMMMASREPDGLKEHEYFNYLSKVKRWDLWEGKLELYSIDSAQSEVILVFVAN